MLLDTCPEVLSHNHEQFFFAYFFHDSNYFVFLANTAAGSAILRWLFVIESKFSGSLGLV